VVLPHQVQQALLEVLPQQALAQQFILGAREVPQPIALLEVGVALLAPEVPVVQEVMALFQALAVVVALVQH
jgi:hypothetical protein